MSLVLQADHLLDSQGQGQWPSNRATCHSLAEWGKEGRNGPFLALSHQQRRSKGCVCKRIHKQPNHFLEKKLPNPQSQPETSWEDHTVEWKGPQKGLVYAQDRVPSILCSASGTAESFWKKRWFWKHHSLSQDKTWDNEIHPRRNEA